MQKTCGWCQSQLGCLRQVLVPPLRELENYIFNQMFNFLWGIMTDFAASDAAGVPVGRPPLHPPSREETAIWRWLEAMQVGPVCDSSVCSSLLVSSQLYSYMCLCCSVGACMLGRSCIGWSHEPANLWPQTVAA